MDNFNLKLTFSGLYLAIVNGEKNARSVDLVDIFLPRLGGHTPRLSFAFEDLDEPVYDSRIQPFVGADGTRYGSVGLDRNVELQPVDTSGVTLQRRHAEEVLPLDYALEVEEIGLILDDDKLERYDKVCIKLRGGTLHAWDEFRDKNNIGQRWNTKTRKEIPLADDLVLYSTGYELLKVATGQDGLEISFSANPRDTVHLCISNDPATIRRPMDPNSPFGHLRLLEALGGAGTDVELPTEHKLTPSNPRCNGVIAYQS